MTYDKILRIVGAIGLLVALKPCLAEDGITASTITLGQSAPFSGPVGRRGTDYRDGANLYYGHVNAQGGVAGRKIKLISLDDSYVAEKTVANTKKLINEERVFALVTMSGTPNVLAVLPLVQEARIPVFAMSTGADSLRKPVNRYLFHIRASYVAEAEKLVEQAAVFGLKDLAVAYQDNAFGKAGLHGAEQAISKRGLRLVATAPIDVNSKNISAASAQIANAKPHAVIVVAAGKSNLDFISAYRNIDPKGWVLAISVVSGEELTKALGEQSRGIVVSQVVPYPWSAAVPAVNEYQDLMKKAGKGKDDYSYANLEGFISAKLFVEALKRVGKDLTREKLITTLESASVFDAGGFEVKFTPDSHNGSGFVDTTMLGPNGKFIK
jgi:branched-chain amino acid transport system substrate-binding protein